MKASPVNKQRQPSQAAFCRVLPFVPCSSWRLLRHELSESDTVLDLGCGPNSRLQAFRSQWLVGVEVFDPYLRRAREARTHDCFIRADVRSLELIEECVDVVIAFDVLDHIEKTEALRLVSKMKSWARKSVILTVSNGYMPAPLIDGNSYMLHRSAFDCDELRELGFEVHGMGVKLPGYRDNFAMKCITYPARWLTYNIRPQAAHDLLGIHRKQR